MVKAREGVEIWAASRVIEAADKKAKPSTKEWYFAVARIMRLWWFNGQLR